MGLPRFEKIIFIFNDLSHKKISYSKFDINFDDSGVENEIIIETNDGLLDDYNFSDVEVIVINNFTYNQGTIRKILEVKFSGYNEQTNKHTSTIKIKFKIIEFNIDIGVEFNDLQSIIRDLKLKRLED